MLDKYLLEEDQQDSERDSIVVLRGMGRGRQARKTCPTVLETVPVGVAGPSDQRDSERGTSRYSCFVGKGAGRELVESVSYPRHLLSRRRHEREVGAAVPEMINCFEV